ncbi:MAG: bifunctional diaminohydroxyphosphoribosylaminopyrimidine deaminase/5-amino-6-(5-phosphoribosylamino)uracil reductase RibD [Nitrospinae bacterium]|nr:bifunctional diaminohydroxyphosphoribosylaminopyrimidine deaminase/5-amino-6-(5-phosphoribosylamino)uracil reductase RibD [Nitrospinota bacterium]MBF0633823.1 bifunctional diaminohydroxyphosphoribosylaminopyrimidine deaminase/5-amino-6-(5-phosphoribosylamino)uracil reductase RibD [Nitrospinota bacterium]
MARAIELARKGKGRTSPNPAVGAVIVKGGRIVGEGWHKKAGAPHAEIAALNSCKTSVRGAELYVTLEPCNHEGKTPPCVPAIVKAGIKRVVVGAKDPSKKPGIKGIPALKRAGVKVEMSALASECGRLIEDFAKHNSTGLPFVTLKTAMTLDGKISTHIGDSKWISSEESRRVVHLLRNEYDAVMVGSDTAIHDDPSLTVRHGKNRRTPTRIIVDGTLRIPMDAVIVETASKIPTIIVTTSKAPMKKIDALTHAGVDVITATDRGTHIVLRWLMEELGRRGVMSVLLEGGGRLAAAMLDECLIDRVMIFIAPKIIGGPNCILPSHGVDKMAEALPLANPVITRVGPDILVDGLLAWPA